MAVNRLAPQDYNETVALWNKNVSNKEVLHKQLNTEAFIEKFVEETDTVKKLNYIYKKDERIVGFANGCYKPTDKIGYITFILTDKEERRKGIGSLLFNELEQALITEGDLVKIDLMFFNPINLEWIVPYTSGHDHPNAPGVDVASEGYLFYKNRGYKDVATQNVYYQLLKDFEYSDIIKEKNAALEAKNLHITYYDPQKHHGLNELFDDFGNELWRETIMNNVNHPDGGDPVLIVEHEGRVCGFTGPLSVQPSGRGYFCGIGIHSEYRAHGAGKVLFSALCKGLKDQGAEYMTLFTGETNPARNIYESAGFRIIRTWMAMRKELKK